VQVEILDMAHMLATGIGAQPRCWAPRRGL